VAALFLFLKPVATAKHIRIYVKTICTFLETIKGKELILVFKNSRRCLAAGNEVLVIFI
jgi:hypothetical protein